MRHTKTSVDSWINVSVHVKSAELLEHPYSRIDYSIAMKEGHVRMYENNMDWAISSQPSNRGRFNDYHICEECVAVRTERQTLIYRR